MLCMAEEANGVEMRALRGLRGIRERVTNNVKDNVATSIQMGMLR